MDALNVKYRRLKETLEALGRVVVAFSGGVDSTFLLHTAAVVLGERCMAVTVVTPTIKRRSIDEAMSFCRARGLHHEVIVWDALSCEGVRVNGPERCYHCKRGQLARIEDWAQAFGAARIIEGSNIDDREDDRPGMRAIREMGVVSPLRLAGLGKDEIRILSQREGISGWDRPPESCLATRVPTGQVLTRDALRQVEQAEAYLNDLGFFGVRVRHHGDVARIELSRDDSMRLVTSPFLAEMCDRFQLWGFTYPTLDLCGYGGNKRGLNPRDGRDTRDPVVSRRGDKSNE